ncbi:MAG: DUF951 domain-containing protein [Thermaerobacter sp.]|nr:DUF951 domain-containing protein [Thermaerobacter sp.]
MDKVDKPRYEINELVELRKAHPCGTKVWLITRTGIDFGLRCQGCGHRVMMPRKTFEKAVRRKLTETDQNC